MGRNRKWASPSIRAEACNLRKTVKQEHPDWNEYQIDFEVSTRITAKYQERKKLQDEAIKLDKLRHPAVNERRAKMTQEEKELLNVKREVEKQVKKAMETVNELKNLKHETTEKERADLGAIDDQFKRVLLHMKYANTVLGEGGNVKMGEVIAFFDKKKAFTPESKALSQLPDELVALLNDEPMPPALIEAEASEPMDFDDPEAVEAEKSEESL